MSVIFLLIPVSLSLSIVFVVLCVRAIHQGQFDDLESPRWRMLFESEVVPSHAPVADSGYHPDVNKEKQHD